MNNFGRNLVFWLAIALMIAFLYNVFQGAQQQVAQNTEEIAYSDFMADARDGRVTEVVIQGQELKGQYSDGGRKFKTIIPENENVVDRIASTGVRIKAEKDKSDELSAFGVLLSWFPMLLLIGVWIFFMRQMQQRGGGGAMGFGKSRAKLLTEHQTKVTF